MSLISGYGGAVPITDFGLKGDGSNEVVLLQAVLAFGVPLDGQGKTFGIGTNLTLPAGATILNANFIELNSTRSNCRTLFSNGVDGITLTNVKVNRNGNGTEGANTDSAAIWISGGKNHSIDKIDITGNGKGNGFAAVGCSLSQFDRIYVHDMFMNAPSIIDDAMQGIWFYLCTDCTAWRPRVERLTGNTTGQDATRFTRGIAVSGTTRMRIYDPYVDQVDQCIDISGGGGGVGNLDFLVQGGKVRRGYTWGLKCANTAVNGRVDGVTAEDCGIAGFVCSPPPAGVTPQTANLEFLGCTAIRTGSNGQTINTSVSGFLILSGGTPSLDPRGIRFVGCLAIDDQATPTMLYGFNNQVAALTTASLNEALNCRSLGHTTAALNGMNYNSVLTKGTNGAVTVGSTFTTLSFDSETVDGGQLHENAVSPQNITIRKIGLYQVSACVAFSASGTGIRQLQILLNGTAVPASVISQQANNATLHIVNVSIPVNCAPGDILMVQAAQSAGAGVTVDMTRSLFAVSRIAES